MYPLSALRSSLFCLACFLSVCGLWAAERQTLTGNVPDDVPSLTAIGRPDPAMRLKLAIGLPTRNQAELTAFLRNVSNPASPGYRHFLTPKEFADRFGPTQEDYQELSNFATANGLQVIGTHPNRLVLDVEGNIAMIEKAFHLTIRLYRHPTENRTFYAPDAEPSLDLSVPVDHISGLDNYSPPRPYNRLKPGGLTAQPGASPQSGSGPSGTYGGNDFRAAYVPGTSLTGAGQSIGLLEFDAYYTSDITSYETQFGLPNVSLTNVAIDGGVTTPGNNNSEVALDIEVALAMAPGISALYVYEAPNGTSWVSILSRMADDNLSRQLSCSWGGGGPNSTAEKIFQQMAAQGQSFFTSSGDSDAYTGAVPFPANSPNVTVVGGTTLTTAGAGGAYVSETVWNWDYDSDTGSYEGSSGGISTHYTIPSYQQGISMATNQGSTTKRNIPDVALTADNVYVVCNNGSGGEFGGTSCAAPLWAGFTALVNQQAAANGTAAMGFLNPALYAIAEGSNYNANFHDTTAGNNFNSATATMFSAVAGYDLCTGLGTPAGPTLIDTLAGTPAPVVAGTDSPAMPPWALAALALLLLVAAAPRFRTGRPR